jgi:hypothetical protein
LVDEDKDRGVILAHIIPLNGPPEHLMRPLTNLKVIKRRKAELSRYGLNGFLVMNVAKGEWTFKNKIYTV